MADIFLAGFEAGGHLQGPGRFVSGDGPSQAQTSPSCSHNERETEGSPLSRLLSKGTNAICGNPLFWPNPLPKAPPPNPIVLGSRAAT